MSPSNRIIIYSILGVIMLIIYLLFILGLIMIIKGGDYFVDGAIWLSRITNLPEVLIGATVVSLATTIPEASVSILSVLQNQTDVALGNVIGSVICNTGFVCGLYSIIKPGKIDLKTFRANGLFLLISLITFQALASKGSISILSSAIFLILLLIYIIFFTIIPVYKGRGVMKKRKYKTEEGLENLVKFVVGISLIIIGSNLLIDYGIEIANYWNVSTGVIGLSIISLGTSLPELVTAVSALIKGHDQLSIGNIIGANILNITMIMGFSSLIRPIPIDNAALSIHIPILIIVNSVLIIPSIITRKISRIQALLMLLIYSLYIIYLYI